MRAPPSVSLSGSEQTWVLALILALIVAPIVDLAQARPPQSVPQ